MFVSVHGMWLILVVCFAAILIGASEAGFRLGRKAGSGTAENAESQLGVIESGVIEGGILAVLGLLLGFTMSMAVTRFEVRKQLVLDEANAIGTSYLRTSFFLPPRVRRLPTFSANMSLSGFNTQMSATTRIGSRPSGNKPHGCRMNFGLWPSLMGKKTQALSDRDYSCNL
jgi:hypothetical protein